MAILNVTSSLRLGKRAALVLVSCLATGCAIFSVFGGKPYAFDHKVHLKEGLECNACHTTWDSSDKPGMPTQGGCKLCHDALDAEKPPARHIDVLFDGENFKAKHVSALPEEVVFSHKRHATKPVECKSCHVGIDENERIDASLAVGMKECRACHEERKVAAECATCHQHIRTDVAPASHHLQWTKMHGPTVRAESTATVNNCTLCHTESTCSSCHEAVPPENHNEVFRHRSHGLYAKMDRQNCAACHRSDSCDACHQETRPMSHTGSFGGTVSNHCVGCHLPLQTTECFTCHKDTPSHGTATPLPAGHTPGMDCRMCHGHGQPLPHVDKGDACSACHR